MKYKNSTSSISCRSFHSLEDYTTVLPDLAQARFDCKDLVWSLEGNVPQDGGWGEMKRGQREQMCISLVKHDRGKARAFTVLEHK